MPDESTTTEQQKRAIVGARKKRQLQMAAAAISALRHEFPEIEDLLLSQATEMLREASRTREGDRQAVLDTLAKWPETGLTAADIAEEASLPSRTVRAVLEEMRAENPAPITYREQGHLGERGRPVFIFKLR